MGDCLHGVKLAGDIAIHLDCWFVGWFVRLLTFGHRLQWQVGSGQAALRAPTEAVPHKRFLAADAL